MSEIESAMKIESAMRITDPVMGYVAFGPRTKVEDVDIQPLVYLASPYSSPYPAIRLHRYEQVCRAAAKLMGEGKVVFSPIAHSHPIAEFLPADTLMDHDFWMKQCLPIVRRSTTFCVLMLDGWRESRGVKREMAEAMAHSIPVVFIKP